MNPVETRAPLQIAVIGAGPVGLALALQAARALPAASITVFDARPADKDVSGDPRTLALSLGSVQLLERLGAWRPELAQPILEVHVSQQPPSMLPLLGYGSIVAPLQQVWMAAVAAEPDRLHSRFGQPVAALKNMGGGVEVDAG